MAVLGAHASRVLASASSRSRTLAGTSFTTDVAHGKIVSARHRNQHAGRVCSPITRELPQLA